MQFREKKLPDSGRLAALCHLCTYVLSRGQARKSWTTRALALRLGPPPPHLPPFFLHFSSLFSLAFCRFWFCNRRTCVAQSLAGQSWFFCGGHRRLPLVAHFTRTPTGDCSGLLPPRENCREATVGNHGRSRALERVFFSAFFLVEKSWFLKSSCFPPVFPVPENGP